MSKSKIVKSVTRTNEYRSGIDSLEIIYEDFTYELVKNVSDLKSVISHLELVAARKDPMIISNWIGKDFTEISNDSRKLGDRKIKDIIFNQLIF